MRLRRLHAARVPPLPAPAHPRPRGDGSRGGRDRRGVLPQEPPRVTTSSKQALKAYNEARENDLKMYEREAISGYAAALQYDPHFVMATLRLAEKIRGRDPERAKSLLLSAARSRDGLTPREQLMLKIYEERWGRHDPRPWARSTTSTCVDSRTIPEGYLMRCYFLGEPEADRRGPCGIRAPSHGESELRHRLQRPRLCQCGARRLREGRGLPQALPLPRAGPGEPSRFARRALRAHRAVRRSRGRPQEGARREGRLLPCVRPPRDRGNRTGEIRRKPPSTFSRRRTRPPSRYQRLDFRFYASIALLDAGDEESARKERDLFAAEAAGLPQGLEAERLSAHIAFCRRRFSR